MLLFNLLLKNNITRIIIILYLPTSFNKELDILSIKIKIRLVSIWNQSGGLNMNSNFNRLSIRKVVIIGVLGGITAVLGMTPLGFIPVGPTRATIMHIPVIIGSIMEGPLVGGFIGLIFGLFSIFQAITNPTPVSFAFLNPIVSILPRILIGIISYYVYDFIKKISSNRRSWVLYVVWIGIFSYLIYGIYKGITNFETIWSLLINFVLLISTGFMAYYANKKFKNGNIEVVMAAVAGTLTNTVGVLFSIYMIYAERFVQELGYNIDMARKVIVGIGLTNGIPEVIIAIIIVTNVVTALKGRN